jgi:trypsin-like peptidase
MADPRAAVTVRALGDSHFFSNFDEQLVDRQALNTAEPIELPSLEGEIPSGDVGDGGEGQASRGKFHGLLDLHQLVGASRPSTIPPHVPVVPEPPLAGAGPESGPVEHPMQFPPRAVGKLFCYRGGVPKFGTGWVVGPRHVLTAAHCAYRVGLGWIDRAVFVPGYGAASAPIINGIDVVSPVGWSNDNPQNDPADFLYDLAVIRADRPLIEAMGSLGWVSSPGGNACTSLGYPGSHPAGLWRSTGQIAPQGEFIKMRNDLDEGCSGGPWVAWPGGNPIALGINSFRLSNDPTTAYSPPFHEVFLRLMAWVEEN